MIIYVTPAECNGGILQFSITMLEKSICIDDSVLFVPDSVNAIEFDSLVTNIQTYPKTKSLIINKPIRTLAHRIKSYNPDMVIFLEDSILMHQLNNLLKGNGFPTAIVVHDVIQHPYRNLSKRKAIVELIRRSYLFSTVSSKDDSLILLSNNSKQILQKSYKKIKAKIFTLRLGAHVPQCGEREPYNVKVKNNFFLFFGRIDKYKGIKNLLTAYCSFPEEFKNLYHLIIAGKGSFSDEELEYINKDTRHIHILNRFIEDAEMKWLFSNSLSVILPYIEASQSGVLPIAYYYLKPVIVSNLPGLIENIDSEKTGYIFSNIDELHDQLSRVALSNKTDFEICIKKYYMDNFNWENNIRTLVSEIKERF